MFGYGFSLILCLPFVPLRQKRIVFLFTGIVFLIGQSDFVSKWPKGELLVFCVGFILLTKSLLCNVAVIIKDAGCFRVFISE
jgi:hypothetical protein